ncbi:hypothetical protein ABPG77_009304 [Micractinium sp. CCAP 211/92]
MACRSAVALKRLVNSPAVVAVLLGFITCAAAASFETKLSLVLPWSDTQDSQRAPAAVFDGGDSTNVLVAVAGLTSISWEVAGFAVTAGPASAQVGVSRAWTTQLPMGGSIPTAVAAAGGLAVLELDGRVMALQPRDGGLAWNASSPCTLGRPRFVSARSQDAVYLICQELSGDSTLIALHPANGTTAWAISSSSVAQALVPVRAATAAPGALIYADVGSNVTALSAADGALLWQLDIGPLALSAGPAALPGSQQGTSVTHLELAGDVLLVREYAAGLSFSAGPFSYLALKLSASRGPPSLLWSSAPAQRDRLPLGLTEASPAVPPAVCAKDGLFYYWSATAPPAQSPLGAPVEPQWMPEATAAGAAAGAPSPAAQRRLLAEGLAAGAAPSPAPGASNATGPAPSASPAATAAAVNAASAAAAAQAAAQAVLAAAVPMQTQGLGVVAPEGVLPTPVLKARSLRTGEVVWTAPLQPVSAPSAAAGSVAVVTPDGLQVLDAASGAPRWAAGQHPLGIYPYTPTLLGNGGAAAVRNCLDTLASNSLCIYSQAPQELPAPGDDGQAEAASAPTSGVPLATGGWPLLGQLGGPAATATARLLLVAAAGAALILLF